MKLWLEIVSSFTIIKLGFCKWTKIFLDFHICTGHKPAENVYITMLQIGHEYPMNVSTSMEWLKDGYGTDPLSTYTEYICIILFLANIQTGLYSYTMYISSTIVEINKIIWNNPKGIVTAITSWRQRKIWWNQKHYFRGNPEFCTNLT